MMRTDEWSNSFLRELETGSDDEPLFPKPDNPTQAGCSFHIELVKTIRAVCLLGEVTTVADNATFVARRILQGDRELPANFDPATPLPKSAGLFSQKLAYVSSTVLEMACVRIADNFTTYLSEIIRECLIARPELLRSNENITFEMALRCASIEELRSVLVDRKVEELAYLGFGRLSEWLGKRLGISDLENLPARSFLLELLETRNCLVHNRGRANAKYLRTVGQASLTAEQKIKVDLDTISLGARATAECVKLLDEALSQKFNLKLIMND